MQDRYGPMQGRQGCRASMAACRAGKGVPAGRRGKPLTLKVLSVNRACTRPVRIGERTVQTAIGKVPVEGAVAVGRLGLEGDEQADPTVHGGLTRAVYAYPAEHYAFWQTVRAQARVQLWGDALPPGSMGENLTLQGLREQDLWVGDRLVLPGCTLAVTEPRMPCFKFNAAMGFAQASKLMKESGFCGTYLAVAVPGAVRAGDAVELVPGPREVTLAELFRARR